ncbi:integral membrane Yip1 family protein isoform X2 [Wolffia australiana]
MDNAYGSLPSSHLLGSVPAVIPQSEKSETRGANPTIQNFPPGNGGYQAPGSSNESNGPTATSWAGVFSISSYSPYFNVDTDVVVDRLMGSVYPLRGDFISKIDANPDLYAPVWVSTTLVFMLAAMGNCAAYLMARRKDPSSTWNFDVSYFNWAAGVVYGYAVAAPVAAYFLLQYLGSGGSLVRLCCLWGYSLFVFLPASLLMMVPLSLFRWLIALVAGSVSAGFVSFNLKAYAEGNELMVWVVSAFLLHFCFAVFLKVYFFA